MPYRTHDTIPVWGQLQDSALQQIKNCLKHDKAVSAALMADHHHGYVQPIGGVIAYHEAISPSGVGYDIACGNKAVRLDISAIETRNNISLGLEVRINNQWTTLFSMIQSGNSDHLASGKI